MSLPKVVSREEWLVARKALLAREKKATRARDALNADRRRLPMVTIDKDYLFEGPAGKASLLDLFDGRRQLIAGPRLPRAARQDRAVQDHQRLDFPVVLLVRQ